MRFTETTTKTIYINVVIGCADADRLPELPGGGRRGRRGGSSAADHYRAAPSPPHLCGGGEGSTPWQRGRCTPHQGTRNLIM